MDFSAFTCECNDDVCPCAVVTSGYEVAPTRAINHLLDLLGPIAIPSLHLWGTNGRDKQISPSESRSLADLFEEGQRQFIEHGGGHFIPCSSPFIDLYRSFLTPLAKGH
jgi:pimeloyl-ACP methyl ester carboxylesterase